MNEDKLRAFSVEEVCERLGLHRTTVQKLLRQGRLKGFKIGRIWKIPALALDEFLRVEAGLDMPPGPETETEASGEFEFSAEAPELSADNPVVAIDNPADVDNSSVAGIRTAAKHTSKGFSAAFSRRFPMEESSSEDE